MTKSDIRSRLIEICNASSLSDRKISEMMGANLGYINRIRNNEDATVTTDMMVAFINAMGITFSQFADTEDKDPVRSCALLYEFNRMDSDCKDLLITVSKNMRNKK